MGKIKIGINGFGRIGRFVFRSTLEPQNVNDVEVVAINDLLSVDYLAYLLKYDTMHGRFNGTVEVKNENTLVVNGKEIRIFAERDAENIKWGEVEAEYVVKPVLNMLFFLLLLRRAKTVVKPTCSFAVLTLTNTTVNKSFLTHLAQPTAWLLSPKC